MAQCPDGYSRGFGIPQKLRPAVCMTRSYFGKASNGLGIWMAGSGFLISMKSRSCGVLTAAHNIYHPQYRRKAQWVDFYFKRDGQVELAKRRMTRANVPREFTAGGANHYEWDFAIAWMGAVLPDRFRPIKVATSTATHTTQKILVGYPNEGRCNATFRPRHAQFAVKPYGPNTYSYLDQPSYGGLSGGPLLSQPSLNEELSAYGLHTLGGRNGDPRAIRFSPPVIRRLRGWVSAS